MPHFRRRRLGRATQPSAMSLRDFSLFLVICLVWALNTVAAKIVVTDMHVPPLFFGMLRSAVIALAVFPWLLPMPRPHWRIVVVGILMGGGGFALFFVGLKTASPSAASIVGQLGVPMRRSSRCWCLASASAGSAASASR